MFSAGEAHTSPQATPPAPSAHNLTKWHNLPKGTKPQKHETTNWHTKTTPRQGNQIPRIGYCYIYCDGSGTYLMQCNPHYHNRKQVPHSGWYRNHHPSQDHWVLQRQKELVAVSLTRNFSPQIFKVQRHPVVAFFAITQLLQICNTSTNFQSVTSSSVSSILEHIPLASTLYTLHPTLKKYIFSLHFFEILTSFSSLM